MTTQREVAPALGHFRLRMRAEVQALPGPQNRPLTSGTLVSPLPGASPNRMYTRWG
jgi:hypothetical protein